jgi:hypothetical protein
MQTRTENRRKFNCKAYRQITFRIRKGSELDRKLYEFLAESPFSLNFLITALLCSKLKCRLPHREYTLTKREKII